MSFAWAGLLRGRCALGLLLAGPAWAADAPADAEAARAERPEAQIRVMNRVIATLRGSLFGISAAARAGEAERRIDERCTSAGDAGGEHGRPRPRARMVQLDGAMMFAVMPGRHRGQQPAGGAGRGAACRRGAAAGDRRIAREPQPEVAADRPGGVAGGHGRAGRCAAVGRCAGCGSASSAGSSARRWRMPTGCVSAVSTWCEREGLVRFEQAAAERGVLAVRAAAGLRMAERGAGAVPVHAGLGRAAQRLPVRPARALRAGHRARRARTCWPRR